MKNTLVCANQFLHDPETRHRLIAENAWQSSVFEGAQGLKRLISQPIMDASRVVMASVKNDSSKE